MDSSAVCFCKCLPADNRRVVVGANVDVLHQDSLDGAVLHEYACIFRSRFHAQPGNVAIEYADYDSGFLFIDDSLAVYDLVSVHSASLNVSPHFSLKPTLSLL